MACHTFRTLLHSDYSGSHNVCFLDLCFSLDCAQDIKKAVQNFTPDVIGISIRNIDDTGGYNVHFLLEDVKNDVVNYCKKEFSGPIVIYTIAKRFSFRYPNFYFYEKEHIIPGQILSIGNILLKVLHSRQPVWRLLVILKRIEWSLGIGLVKRVIYELKMVAHGKTSRITNGFSLIMNK